MNNTNTLQILDVLSLQTVVGGQAGSPGSDDQPQRRSWGQVAREYGAACVMGAGQSLVDAGMPKSVKGAAISAATGCATGMGMKAFEDVSGRISGQR